MTMASTTETGWADLPADLLGCVIARLPFPGDRVRICAACRAWRDAARRHVRHQSPWIVLPNCSFCITGRDGAFYDRIPGLPAENVTCLAAAAEGWLALDCTDDAFRRTPFMDTYCPDTRTYNDARPDVKHTHTYLLHNPFSGVTVPLPELDAIVGHVAETFEIRKVLMRSTTDDLIAVTTYNWNYNVILCRPGKGMFVLPYFRIIDAAFVGNTLLYGITSGEELLAFHLGEDEDGRPKVTRFERVITNPVAAYYENCSWRWPQIDDDDGDGDYNSVGSNEEENQHHEEHENQQQEEEESNDEDEDEEAAAAANPNLMVINDDGTVSDNEVMEDYCRDRDVPYDAEDEIITARYLVRSSVSGEELLLVRHERVSCPYSDSYTSKVKVLKADVDVGRWVPVTADWLGEGETIFLSRSFSKSTRARGGDDIEEGLVYYASSCDLDDVFDTRSWTIRKMAFRWPWQLWKLVPQQSWLTWLFPPGLVV